VGSVHKLISDAGVTAQFKKAADPYCVTYLIESEKASRAQYRSRQAWCLRTGQTKPEH
jgi:hypothetical protein